MATLMKLIVRRLAIPAVFISLLLFACGLAAPGTALAYLVFQVPDGAGMVGSPSVYTARSSDTLLDVARDNDLGYNEIVEANPGLDPWLPGEGQDIVLPIQWLLPDAPHDGIVLNLGEMRMFYFYSVGRVRMVSTYPIGVGQEGWDTPLGTYRVTGKEANPAWHPPKAIRLEKPELPEVVPPGPDNPLGEYKVTLDIPGYLIHGTNRPLGVGRRVSHGCIRLYPDDIKHLYTKIKPGTPVHIIYQPVKVRLIDGRVMVEVHDDYMGKTDLLEEALACLARHGVIRMVEPEALVHAVREKRGLPADVTAGETRTAEGPVDTE